MLWVGYIFIFIILYQSLVLYIYNYFWLFDLNLPVIDDTDAETDTPAARKSLDIKINKIFKQVFGVIQKKCKIIELNV